MKTGQLITSFLQGKASPIMTSTTSNPYAEAATGESKTVYCNESPGAILDTARGRVMTGGGSYWAAHRPRLLKLRRRRPKHRGTLIKYGWRAQLLWMRLSWRSHWLPELQNKIAQVKKFAKVK
jgi:hypothetical protein